ncbi:MAG: ABC transporter substrate-binding protein, partial [Pseudomonadota bacterium]
MALTKCAVVAALGLFVSSAALATDGVTPSKVTFGQVAAFEGPAAALGTSLRDGLHAAFEEA